MIKKLLILYLFIFLSGCNLKSSIDSSINTSIFVDCIGIDYNNENMKYKIYYHSTSSSSQITSEMGSTSAETTYSLASSEKDNIFDAINEISLNTNKNIYLTHIRSIVLSLNFINEENLKMFNDFIMSYKNINIDFNIYSTSTNLETLFSYQNPESINSHYSIITELDELIPYKVIKYNDFANAMYEEYIPIKFINIDISNKIWSDNNGKIKTLYIKGYTLYDNNTLLNLDSSTFKFINLLYNIKEIDIVIDNICFTLSNPKIYITDSKVKINTSVYISSSSEENKKELLKVLENNIIEEFNNLYQECYKNNIDFFCIKDMLYRKNKLDNTFLFEKNTFEYDFNFKILS